MKERWIRILEILNNEEGAMSLKDLAKKMHITERTIKKYILDYKQEEENNGIKIVQNIRKQYSLKIIDNLKFNRLIYGGLNNFDERSSRIVFILERLILKDDFVRIENIAEELFVSRATLDRLMPNVREILSKYDLSIISKPKYGIKLIGEEMNKRSCYAHEIINKTTEPKSKELYIIQTTLQDKIEKYNLILNEINFYNLVQHCIIAIDRIKMNNILTESKPSIAKKNQESESLAAKEIVQEFKKEFQIDIPESEVEYIKMHLLGKRVVLNNMISEEVFSCIDKIIEVIYEKTNIDFKKDFELKMSLAVHFQPLLSRLEFGLKQKNPILQEIKREMPKGFELSVYAAEVISDWYHLTVNDDELAYIALHFSVALDKRAKVGINKKIVIVCASGRGTSRLLQHRLVKRYNFKPENLVILSSFQLNSYNFSDTMFILSTIPLKIEIDIPILLIDMLFSDKSARKVDQLIQSFAVINEIEACLKNSLFSHQKSLLNREEVFSLMCNQIKEEFPEIEETFLEQVIKRENVSSTEVGNYVALPHPYVYDGKKLIVCCMSLEKPIRWKFDFVNLVILMAIPQEEDFINQKISEIVANILSDEVSIIKLTNNTTKETFLDLISRR